jgi:hypothetical protein
LPSGRVHRSLIASRLLSRSGRARAQRRHSRPRAGFRMTAMAPMPQAGGAIGSAANPCARRAWPSVVEGSWPHAAAMSDRALAQWRSGRERGGRAGKRSERSRAASRGGRPGKGLIVDQFTLARNAVLERPPAVRASLVAIYSPRLA